MFALSAISYGKALHMIKYADHNGFPIITFVDTPGAFADLKSEELGQVPMLSSCIACCIICDAHYSCNLYISNIWCFMFCDLWCNVNVYHHKLQLLFCLSKIIISFVEKRLNINICWSLVSNFYFSSFRK